MICNYYPEPSYIFFTTDLPPLLYYSHIPITILALTIGLFVFLNNRKALLNQLLLLISLCFTGWTVINLYAWTNIHSDIILTIWPFFAIFSAFISILSIYFFNVFITKKDLSLKTKVVFLTLLLPVLVFAHTDLSVSGFNISDCDAFGFEGMIYNTYYALLGVVAMIWILYLLLKNYNKADEINKKQILLMGVGIEFFLFSFFTILFLSSYLANIDFLSDSRSEFYGLYGMGVFMTFIGILIVKFKTFNIGMVASQALLVALIILTSSQFTYVASRTGTVITAVTLVFTAVIGIVLVRSVKKEIQQRKELENLTQKLAVANGRLKELDKLKSEFVSIASHQLRSPLTAIRGYASLLREGNYGKIPAKGMEALERIEDSSKLMAIGIEDYLNVSRIESGNMKYNMADFNLRDETEKICDDLRQDALKKGLTIIFRSDLKSQGIVNADIGKTVQILQNLIHNSIKYTPKGSIRVLVRDDVVKKKIFVDIVDTGIGMDKEALETVFEKFERAKNANTVNISGTGLGLYVALKMAEAMGGGITAHSEGADRGSRFTIEMPLAM